MNFKKTMIALAALLAATTAHAGWWRTYGTEDDERGFCVQVTSDENYIITGTWTLLKVDTSGNNLWTSAYEGLGGRWVEETFDNGYIVTTREPSVLKINEQGDSLWSKDYGMYSYCAQPTYDGGYIVVGGDNGYEADQYIILVKTDSEGDTIWTRRYGDPDHHVYSGFFIQETADNGYVITGLHAPISGEEWSVGLLLMKTDFLGDTLWTKTYGAETLFQTNAKGYCVRQTNDNGYVIVGFKAFSPRGLWLVKTDAVGDTLWTKVYSTSSGGTGYSVQETVDGGYIITGVTESFIASSSLGTAKLWLLKTDEQGDTLWTRQYYGDGFDVERCVEQTSDLGYIVVGYTSSHGAGEADIYLLKTDSLGFLSIGEAPTSLCPKKMHIVNSVGQQIILHYSDCPHGFLASIFDASGRKVDEIHNPKQSGVLIWGKGYSPGVYFFRVEDHLNKATTAKVVLVF